MNNGFKNVFVCDFAEEPLNNLQKRCPAIKKDSLLQIDFFEINTSHLTRHAELDSASVLDNEKVQTLKRSRSPSGQGDDNFIFDLIIEQTFFCALDPALRQKYFDKMHSLLKPGGKLAGVLFNCQFDTATAPFGGTKEEYKQYFEKQFKINVYEECRNSIKPRIGRELFINLEKKIKHRDTKE